MKLAKSLTISMTLFGGLIPHAPAKNNSQQNEAREAQTAWLIDNVRLPNASFTRYGPPQQITIENGKISRLDAQKSPSQSAKSYQRLDGKGGYLLAGLVEAHGHLVKLGQSLETVNLAGAKSLDETLARIRQASRQQDAKGWLIGRGWDQNLWPQKDFPTATDLDKLKIDRPMLMVRVDGHAAWLNRQALQLSGINKKTQDPQGGRILRKKNGEASGILIDRAMDLSYRVLPKPSRQDKERWVRAALQHALQQGVTAFHDAGTDATTVQILKDLQKRGDLPLRVYVMLNGRDEQLLQQHFSQGPWLSDDGMLSIRSVKLMADGALGSRGAALLEPYSDEPHHHGLMILNQDQIQKTSQEALQAGFQLAVHAIGDRANREVLNAFAKTLGAMGPKKARQQRLRIEHAQILDAQDIGRFAQLGVIASMQPQHCTSDRPWVPERIGAARTAEGAYVWQKLRKSGATLAFGSDVPVEPMNPFLGFYAAITRQRPDQTPAGGWDPAQRLSRAATLHAYTQGAAYAAFAEDRQGQLAENFDADLIIVNQDLTQIEPQKILETQVLHTMVGGQLQYSRQALPSQQTQSRSSH